MSDVLSRQFFTSEELYEALNDDTILKILLYLMEKNPKVPLDKLSQFIGKSEKETLQILNSLEYKRFIDIEGDKEYNLNSRMRNVLSFLLSSSRS